MQRTSFLITGDSTHFMCVLFYAIINCDGSMDNDSTINIVVLIIIIIIIIIIMGQWPSEASVDPLYTASQKCVHSREVS